MIRDGHATSKPAAVVLWRLGNYADRYLACLQDARIEVAVCVDEQRAGSSIAGVPIVSPHECARQSYRYARFPVVVTATAADGLDGFNDAARSIACEFDLPAAVLHPVFLAAHLDLRHDGNVLLAGFPAAGENVMAPILGRLLARRPRAAGPREELFSRLSHDYHHHTLMPALDELFDLGGRFASRGWSVEGDRIRVEMRLSHARRATLCNLRSPTFLHERLHSTHERLTDATVARFRQMGWTIVAIVRHPVDLLVASGTRLTRDPASMLADLEWFRSMAVLVKDYYECLLGQGDHVAAVRREDLLRAPARTICRLGEAVGVEVSAEQATAIWDAATLEGAAGDPDAQTGHGAAPSPRAWRQLLDPRHAGILRDLGYGPLLGALGYATTLDVDAARPTPLLALGPTERRDAAYRDFEYHALYGKPVDLQHEGLRYWRDPTLGLSMLTTDPDLCQLATIGLASRYFRLRLLASSAHGLDARPRP
jgi:hypothetical protein